jgi:two-component system, NtrC family, sensor kinase
LHPGSPLAWGNLGRSGYSATGTCMPAADRDRGYLTPRQDYGQMLYDGWAVILEWIEMKLARKLAVLLLLGMMLVLVLALVAAVRREIQLFDTDMKRDHQILGRALAVAAARTWSVDGEEVAIDLINRVNSEQGQLRARLRSFDGGAEPIGQQLRASGLLQSEIVETGRPSSLVTWVRIPLEGPAVVAIELSESTVARHNYVLSTILRWVATAVGVALVSGVIAIAVGIAVVGRRVDELVSFARRIGAGDTSGRITSRGHDELSELAVAMNGMAEELAAIQGSLRQESEARLLALEQLRHADRLATIGKLASGIAHELGTPLNVVGGRARMIQRCAGIDEDSAKNARIISEQSERMTTIIRQLLDFARAAESRKQSSDLRLLVEQASHLLAPMAKKKSVEIRTELPNLSVMLDLDQNQIHQVLTNLIVNGIQAMANPGTVTVRLALCERTDEGHCEPATKVALITVSDQGTGILEAVLPHIFEPFCTTKDIGEGTGLGLSVAWGIVREHGGRIYARNLEQGGAEFSVELPIERGG